MSWNWTPGADAVAAKGWLKAHKWLLLRRLSQAFFLCLFLVGPLAGIWIVKGNLASSLTLDFLPLTDPYIFLQSLAAGHDVKQTAIIGVTIVAVAYLLIGGRVYCSWVCPVNAVTDLAYFLRQKLGFKGGARFSRQTRYWLLVMTILVAFVTGSIAWELVNPVTMLFRGVVFGIGLAWAVVLAVFAFDAFVSNRGWCGHLCPVGAFYSLLGRFSLLRISAVRRQDCNNCNDCYAICPEAQVITQPLKGINRQGLDVSPVILSGNCTNCGRCIDVCAPNVFAYTNRFDDRVEPSSVPGGPPVIHEAA